MTKVDELIGQINALLSADKTGQVSHRLPGLAKGLLTDAAAALTDLQAQVAAQDAALQKIELISTNHGGWFENGAWEWGQMMGNAARQAMEKSNG